MKALLLLLGAAALASAVSTDDLNHDLDILVQKVAQSNGSLEDIDTDIENLYDKFKQTFRSEENLPSGNKEKFERNIKDIIQHNLKFERGEVTFDQGISQFSDMDSKDILIHFTGYEAKTKHESDSVEEDSDFDSLFPERVESADNTVDWSNVLPPVEYQGECGSSYAFSALGVVEAAYGIKAGKPISMSKQYMIDCNRETNGCQGGNPEDVLSKALKGVPSSAAYPYKAKKGNCLTNKGEYRIKKIVNIPSGDEEKLLRALDKGAVSISIDVTDSFSKYRSGIYSETDCDINSPNHAMLAIGYGEENGIKYVLVRNSWDNTWGDKGLAKIVLDKTKSCGLPYHGVTATLY